MTGVEPTPFSDLVASLAVGTQTLVGELPPDWLQGRTAYGGLSAALCLHAIDQLVPDLPPLRSAQFCFLGPAVGTLHVAPEELRRGKSAVFVGANVTAEKGLAARATFVFGVARPSYLDHTDLPMPAVAGPDDCPAFFGAAGQPAFMDHFDGRLAAGAKPGTPGAAPGMTVWLRHTDRNAGDSLTSLLAMADALPPPATIMFRARDPISTITWSIDVLDPAPHSETGWWLAESRAETAREGYSTQVMTIWSPDGRPVISGRQNVATFEK